MSTQTEVCATWSTNYDQLTRLGVMMWSLTSTRIVRFVVVPILSLWIAGAGCMMGCEGMVAAAPAGPIPGQEKDSGHHSARKAAIVASGHCSASGSHTRSTSNAGETKQAVKRTDRLDTTLLKQGGSPSGRMNCPLAVSRAVIAAKIRINEIAAAPELPHSNLPAENVLDWTSPFSSTTRLPNRGHTYLRCCVFLI